MERSDMGVKQAGLWIGIMTAVILAAGAQDQSGQPLPPAAAPGNEPESRTVYVHIWSGSGQRNGDHIQILPDAASAESILPLLRDLPYGTLQLLDTFTIGENESSVDRPLPDGIQFQYKRNIESTGPLTALIRVQVPSPDKDGKLLDAIRSTVRLDAGQGVLLRGIPRGSDELLVLVSRPSSGSNEPQSGDNQQQREQQKENQSPDQQQPSESQENQQSSQPQDQKPSEQEKQNQNQNSPSSDQMDQEQTSESQQDRQNENKQPENEGSMENIRGLLNALEEADQQERKEQLRQLRNRVEVQGDWW